MTTPDISVSGGAGGLEADLEDLEALGRSSTDLAEFLAETSARCHPMLLDPDLLASAVLDPAGVARFEAALLEALDGPAGLTALGLRFGARALVLRSAAATYEAADAALAELADDLGWASGFFWPATLGGGLALLAGAAFTDPAGTAVEIAELWADPERWLTEHPGLVDGLVNAAPGLGSFANVLSRGALSRWLGGGDVRVAAGKLAQLWPDGTPVVTDRGVDIAPEAAAAPRSFADLFTALGRRNNASGPQEVQVDVRVVTHADGTRAYIVDIPGTQDWSPPSSTVNPRTNDLGTNVHVLGGDSTTRQLAIAEALRRAGASSTDPVMLVGHSQGGMVAAQAAHDAGTPAFDFNVQHVVTAGSPIARADVPPSVQVLALENEHDIVPHLDGRANDDDPNVTTVGFSTQNGSIATNHGIGTAYQDAAAAVDASTDPSIAAYRASASPFFVGPGETATVEAHVYSISRR